MDALAELLALRRRLPDVAGTVLAAVDGMLIAMARHQLRQIEEDLDA